MNRLPGDELRALVVKEGVALGGLTAHERTLALAVVWRCVSAAWARREAPSWSEREANAVLKQALAQAAAFLATDHVELRRWLIDAGWMSRDGFGRAYVCVELGELAPDQQAAARCVPDAVTAWVADQRATLASTKERRKLEWQQRQRAGRA